MEGRRPNDSATDFINDKNPGLGFARRRATTGFTIVELLIVVVVIAILAAITIVAYNGITNQSRDAALKSDLSTTAKKVGLAHAETGTYPSTAPDGTPGTVQYSGGGSSYCATASGNGKAFRITQDGNIQSGTCSGHSPVVGTMQSFTQAKCNALATYDGSNESAVIGLTDSRGGITRTYQVAKLADGKCWMLNNLKLGSTTSSITLTPADSNVTDSFTLPQLTTSGSTSYDLPRAYGPVPGDIGAGAANYGYLYNWPAATAGATRATNPSGSGAATSSICPVGWRLPSGSVTGEFAMLNAKMNNPNASSPTASSGTGFYQNWQISGPFKGVFAGEWAEGEYFGTADYSDLWSASTHGSIGDFAHEVASDSNAVYPGSFINRNVGIGVRCLLN